MSIETVVAVRLYCFFMCILYHKTETIISAIHPTAYAVGFLASVSVKKAAARFSGHVPSRPVCSGRMRDFTHRGLSRNSGAGMSGGGACAKTPGGNGALLRLNCRTLFPSCARPNSFSPLFSIRLLRQLGAGRPCLPAARTRPCYHGSLQADGKPFAAVLY